MVSPEQISDGETFSGTTAKQLYVSFMVYMFDILSYISVSFVIPYMAKDIYPSKTIGISLLITFGGFAAGAVSRPFGVGLFSKWIDNYGRKKTLYVTLTLSSLLTASLAFIPTYSQVGDFSPVIYITLRLIAGVFIGALISGGLVLGTENYPEKLRGFLGGLTESGAHWAHAVGGVWFLVTTLIAVGAAFTAWGWRLMFLVALLPLVLVLPVLHFTPESQIFVKAKEKKVVESSPLRALTRKGKTRTTLVMAILMAIGLNGYTSNTDNVFPTFLREVNKLAPTHIAFIALIGGLLGVLGAILGGAISQKIGRRNLAIGVGILLMIGSYLFIPLGKLPGTAYYSILLITMPIYFMPPMLLANFSIFLNESFKTGVRGTGLGLAWNLGYSTAAIWPLIISAFIAAYGIGIYPMAQFVLVGTLSTLFVIMSIVTKDTRGNILREKQEMNESLET